MLEKRFLQFVNAGLILEAFKRFSQSLQDVLNFCRNL